MSDPFNCPGCGSHDYGMYGPTFGFCPWCAKYENGSLRSENADLRHDIERHVKIAADQATELADLRAKLEEVRKDAERTTDPMDNWLMAPALEWLEQAEHGHDNERCRMIAALLRDLWRGPAKVTVSGDAAIAAGKGGA